MNVAAGIPDSPAITRPAGYGHRPVFSANGRDMLILVAGTSIGDRNFASAVDVALPELVAGHDYAVVIKDGMPVAVPAAESLPTGSVGGFHFAPGGAADGVKGGDDVPAINPSSIWDAGFRPACPDPRGMALVAGKFWCDIYLTAAHHREGTSRFGEFIADGNDAPLKIDDGVYARFDFETAKVVLAAHGKRMPTAEEFFALAYGVTEHSSAARDPKKTGLDAARTSRWGIMQATGNLWIWGTDGHPDDPRPSLFGGSWISGGDAGSRYASLDSWPESSTTSPRAASVTT